MSESIKIKNTQLVKLSAALRSLDGASEDKKGYEFDMDTYWAIVLNQEAVARAITIFESARKGLLKKHKLVEGEALTPANEKEAREYIAAAEELNEQESEINIKKLLVQKLLGKKIRIAPSAMADLIPILDTSGMGGES